MKIVDTRGLKCPEPLIMTKRALKDVSPGAELQVLTDNDISLENLKRFLNDNSTTFSVVSTKGVHTISIKRGSGELSSQAASDYCEVSVSEKKGKGGEYVVMFSAETMGAGNDDLGLILTKSFLSSLIESAELPGAILFYNSGIKLAVTDSFVIDELKRLEALGVKLLLCGTCLNFYNLKNNIKIGIVSNMLEMTELMISASKVIKP